MHRILCPLAIAVALGACSKSQEPPAKDEPSRPAPAMGTAPASPPKRPPLDEAGLQALAKLDVPGFERTSSAANRMAAQPVYRGRKRNAKGYHAVVQVNVMGCEDCPVPTLAEFQKELPQRRGMMLPAIHKENPRLVYEAFGIDLEGGLQAHAIFTLSHVKQERGSAAAHGLDVFLSTGAAKLYVQVWPRPEVPGTSVASQEELAATFSRDELVATTKAFLAVFLKALP
jgi:hypothetical protein